MTEPPARTRGIGVTAATLALAGAFCFPLAHLLWRGLHGPEGISASEFAAVLADGRFYRLACNSLFLASACAIVSTLLASMAGFALATHRFTGRGFFVAGAVALAALPGQLLLPGGYEVVTRLCLFDTYWAVLLPGSVSVFGVLLYRAAFTGTPNELLAAARIDGCSEWGVWWHIAMPTVRPTTAACLCLAFVSTYNSVVWPMVVLQSDGLATLPMHLANLSGTALTAHDHARVAAASALAMAPVFAVFLLLQRDFLPTLRGAIKG